MSDLTMESVTNESHFWYPLNTQDLWVCFVHCMMTVLDEINDNKKYYHILFVEFCEWIARVAFRYADLKKR